MKGDFTRATFNSEKHYSSVRMQQGRVQLDADWNEQLDITAHRIETEAVDLIGGCGGPIHHAGFHVAAAVADLSADEQARPENQDPGALAAGGDFYVSGGRYYVDGILCENNHIVPYSEQPDWPLDAPAVSVMVPLPATLPLAAGTYLAYLDVWQRHVTALEDEHIREVALGGPDTATRTRTVWQVKLHQLDAAEAAAADCLSSIPSWDAAIAPVTGRLAAQAEAAAAPADPCIVAPGAGFRRLENQLYRVEVHQGGARNVATFKWSRDNGSITSRLESQNAARDEWTVSSLGRDQVLRFASGQWVELTDDTHELLGVPGTLVRIIRAEGNVITVDPNPAARFPAGASVDMADFPDNPRVRRWDGVISGVTNANWRDLEDGVQVRFYAGTYRTGDYWQIPARTATADVEWPLDPATAQPARELPHGIRHHYCRLAMMAFDGAAWTSITDCRDLFPPVTELTSLFYVSGDGQETMPANPVLAQPLQVGVANGQWPVAGATVRFEVTEGNGRVNGTSPSVDVETGADGVASCTWEVDATTQTQEVQATLRDAAGNPVHLPIRFSANLSVASEVAYDPADDCDVLAGVTTVQEALDELCRRGWEEPGIHVRDVVLANNERLRNDTSVRANVLAEGLQVRCDADVLQEAVRNKPVCFVTLYLPFPLNGVDRELWGNAVIGSRPLRLEARVDAEDNVIFWRPEDPVRNWLVNRLFDVLRELERDDRVLAYLTLKGNFIWSDRAEREPLYLDGEVFGRLREDGGTDIILPSGNRLRGGDLEMWFWLAAPARPAISVNPVSLDFGIVPVNVSRDLPLRISNTGEAALNVTGMTTVRNEFRVMSAVPFTVPPGGQQSVTVRFTPPRAATFSDQLTLASNDPQNPQLTVALTGRGQRTVEVARLQFIHNAPGLEAVDFYLNDRRVLDDFTFRRATSYGAMQAEPVRIDVVAASANDNSNPLVSITRNLAANQAYVVILQEQPVATGELALNLLVRENARLASTSENAEFFIVHGVSDAPAFDVRLLGPNNQPIALLADDLPPGGMTEYQALAPASHTLSVIASATGGQLGVFVFDLNALGGRTFTLLASGRIRQQAFTLIGFDVAGNPIVPTIPGTDVTPPLDVTAVTGIGLVRAERLRAENINTAADLAAIEPARLAEVLAITESQANTIIADAQRLLNRNP